MKLGHPPKKKQNKKISSRDEAIFNWVLKVIQDYIGFAPFLCCARSKKLAPFLTVHMQNQIQ